MRINKKNIVFLFIAIVVLVSSILSISLKASDDEDVDIMVTDSMKKAKIPNVSIATIVDGKVSYKSYNTGDYSNISENTLFQLGSVSKAFTGLGILLLEDEGRISIDDPVNKYIPWFTSTLNKDEMVITIKDLLYQTSGFTNDERLYPSATSDMSIEDNIKNLSGRELSFSPSEKFSYANANYNLLGLIIEKASGQAYPDFMKEKIFDPLNLPNTYADPIKAYENKDIIPGYKISFFRAWKCNLEIPIGNIPSGYIISNAQDMGRWMQIQMGLIRVSEEFSRIIEKSHVANSISIVDDSTQYASGWFVDDSTGKIYHSGGVVNYSSKVVLDPERNMAVCVLTNINASTNTDDIADNILSIYSGNQIEIENDVWTIFDLFFSSIAFISITLSIVIIFLISRFLKRTKMDKENKLVEIFKFVLAVALLIVDVIMLLFLPSFFGCDWKTMSLWAPFSVKWGLGFFTIFTILLFVYTMLRNFKIDRILRSKDI